MIAITPHMRILCATGPVDFRKGIDSLAACVRKVLFSDPFCGYLFVFVNAKKTSIKILVYDGQGFWLCQKRLSKGRFCFWPESGSYSSSLDANQLASLIYNDNLPMKTSMWKKIPN
ncbi:MAG: IS66 family insertion sequence element accessory protein TnpB [Actinobacteria bacterium]|nr:IS66 family insertion sequence element accessory protein TnpB [Actinomycetota bacterium]